MKILILEDDDFIRDEVKIYFEMKQHSVASYSNADELFEDNNLNSYDIFLFDINMPGLNGFETLKELKELGVNVPTIFITSMSDVDYVKEAYKLGCSDYIRKPFYFEELELRIKKLLLDDSSNEQIKLNSHYSFNMQTLELLDNNGNEVELNKNEKKLIFLLIKHISHTVDYDKIMEYVWEDKVVNSNTLRTQIKKLRSKLKENFIVNIRGLGYKINRYDQSK